MMRIRMSCFALLIAFTSFRSGTFEGQAASPATAQTSATPENKLFEINNAKSSGGDAAVQHAQPPVTPAGRPRIGLALEGGGALGLAHIGVLQWFEENHIPVDALAGTSMGALIGGLYASGKSPEGLRELATSDFFGGIFTLEAPYTEVDYRRREDRRELPQAFTFGLKGGVSFRNAVLSDTGLNALLRAEFSSYNNQAVNYDRLPIPFRCVATDLNSLEPVVFDGGSMSDAVRASISIPGIFSPVSYHGHYLVDGAIMDNLPTDIAKRDLQADVVIAVHLATSSFTESDVNSILGIFSRAFSAGTARTERMGKKLADVLIETPTEKFSTTDYNKAAALIETGHRAAEQHRSELIRYRLDDAGWAAYLSARTQRIAVKPGLLQEARVEGGSEGARASAQQDMKSLIGKPIDPAKITTALWRVEGNGSYSTSFETFSLDPTGPRNATFAQKPDTGVLVHLTKTRNGPPFLMLGADLTAVNSNVTRNTVDLRFIDQNLGGFGSELRADARFGFKTQASLEYYRQLTSRGLFVQPHVGVLRQPVYLWVNQKRISERFEQQAGGGLDAGWTFNRRTRLAAEWRMQTVRWSLRSGNDSSQNLSGTAQTGAMHFTYDDAVTGAVSPHGLRLDLIAGSLFHSVGSENAPLIQLRASRTYDFRQKNIIGFRLDVDSYMRHHVADPLRFTLGGPLRLTASSIDEYRGTDISIVRAGYLRRIAALPSGLGQGIYLTTAYEAGEVWSPEQRALMRQNGIAGVVVSTPLGVLAAGGSVGDAGRRKMFFTLGRFF